MPFAAPGQIILTVGGRRVVVGGGSGKTYEDWLAYVAAAGAADRSWSDATPISDGLYKTTANTPSGNIVGSPWGNQFRNLSGAVATSRLIQHACATLDIWNDQVGNTRPSLFQVISGSAQTGGYPVVTRNGYASTSSASTEIGLRITVHRYWYSGQAWENNPFSAGTPIPFTW